MKKPDLKSRTQSCLKGDIAESAFIRRALEHGFTVCKPFSQNSPFDFIVASGDHLVRVQVKSIWKPFGDTRRYRVFFATGTRHNRQFFDPAGIDFVAVWLAPEDLWYVIPARLLAGLRNIYLHFRSETYGYYREAWGLLSRHRASARLRRIFAMAEQTRGGTFKCGSSTNFPTTMNVIPSERSESRDLHFAYDSRPTTQSSTPANS